MPPLAAPVLQQQQTAQQHRQTAQQQQQTAQQHQQTAQQHQQAVQQQQTAKQLPQQQCHWQALSHALLEGTLLSDYNLCQSRRQGTGILEVWHNTNQLGADFASAKLLLSYFTSLCKVVMKTGKALAAKGFLSTDPEKLELHFHNKA